MGRRNGILYALAALTVLGVGTSRLEAGFGDAVAGGIVGGVVGSVITNEIYHSGRHHRSSSHRSHRRRHVTPRETDEMRIQRALQSLGYYRGPIDGQVNSFETRSAIKALNRDYGIGDGAYMSPQERDALIYLGTLLKLDRALIDQGTSRRSHTKRVQAALKVLGFYTGKIDGSSGPMTRRSIAEYRRANGLAPSYRLGYEDEYRLISTAKKANDRNIEETLASLKRLGGATQRQSMTRPMAPANQQTMTPPPVAAPAPVPQPRAVPQPAMAPSPVSQFAAPQMAPVPPAPQPTASIPATSAPQPAAVNPRKSEQPVVLEPAQ